MTYIYKVKINRKYLFKKMKVGETFRLRTRTCAAPK